jgi:hypothetical protein
VKDKGKLINQMIGLFEGGKRCVHDEWKSIFKPEDLIIAKPSVESSFRR